MFPRILVLCFLVSLAACFPKAGRVVHFELTAKDPAKLQKFYGELYGWDVQEWQPEEKSLGADPYWMADTPGNMFFHMGIDGGIYRPKEGENPPTPMIYVNVDDMDASLAKAKTLGGEVVFEKMAIPEVGYVAQVRDPGGNVVGLFQYDPKGGTRDFKAKKSEGK